MLVYEPRFKTTTLLLVVSGMDDSEAQAYISGTHKKYRSFANRLLKCFLQQGCISYVKTIYIGYEIDGKMVAALYRHEDRVEVALALDENRISEILIDATHLTWRTMPVAAIVKSENDLEESLPLVEEAANRVRNGKNTLSRSNEFFAKAKEERKLANEILNKKKKRRVTNESKRKNKSGGTRIQK